MNILLSGLKKIIDVLNKEEIDYMIVGGFAVTFYNRARFTNDIDIVIQVYPNNIYKIVEHFPEWKPFIKGFEENAEKGIVWNLMDFETGVKYDFMLYQDSDYNCTAFNRRQMVDFLGIECHIASIEDLIISKLIWYNISKSEKQFGDVTYLLNYPKLNMDYLKIWTQKLYIKTHGLF
jgi:predicted nucleotidyltransferase